MKSMKVTDQLKRLLEESPVSRHRLCLLSGVDAGCLASFIAGRRGMSMESLDALGEVMGLTLTASKATLRALAKDAPSPGRPKSTEHKPRKAKTANAKAAPANR